MPIKSLPSPSQEEVKRRLSYDCMTGIFIWRPIAIITWQHKVWNTKHAGTVAGGLNKKGYLSIRLHEKTYFAHRLAYIYEHGIPIDHLFIDHVNGVISDNRIANLRIATVSENAQNRSMKSYGASGILGVKEIKSSGKWMAYARKDRSSVTIGVFDDKKSAKEASFEWRLANFHAFSGRDSNDQGASS